MLRLQQLNQELTDSSDSQIYALANSILQESQTNPAARQSFALAFSACNANLPLRSQLVEQVNQYYILLRQRASLIDLKPLDELFTQPDYLTTLPEPLLLHILAELHLQELGYLSLTCKTLHAAAATIWNNLPIKQAFCSSGCFSLKDIWEAFSAHISRLPPDEVPRDIAEQLQDPPQPESLLLLVAWLKARDCLSVWKALAQKIGENVPFNTKSAEGMIEQAKNFGPWLDQRTLPQEIDLSDRMLTFLPGELGKHTRMTSLRLDGNNLRELPHELGQLHNLKRLSLQNNKLQTLPEWIGSLTQLESLNLSKNCLRSLPQQLGKLDSLAHLILSSNALRRLPASLSQLKRLRILDISHNQLTFIPEEVTQLACLQNLALSHNAIAHLPKKMERLTSLESLWLSSNRLTSFPTFLCSLRVLHTLCLDQNQITAIPYEIENLTQLERLQLEDNPIPDLPASFYNLSSLRNLFLPEMPPEALKPLSDNPNFTRLKSGAHWLIRPCPNPYDDIECRIA